MVGEFKDLAFSSPGTEDCRSRNGDGFSFPDALPEPSALNRSSLGDGIDNPFSRKISPDSPAMESSSASITPKPEGDFFHQADFNEALVLEELPTEEELTAGDGPALPPIDWAKTIAENQSWLRTVIAARVGDREGVEEVFQNVSLAAVRQKAPIHDPAKVAPWLYRLAVIQTLLYRRKIGRKRKLLDRFTQKVTITENDQSQKEPLEFLLAEERKEMVTQAMSQIPESFQELLLLKYIHDWSYKEMAEKLGMTVSAVQAKLHRARGLLKQRLASKLSPADLS